MRQSVLIADDEELIRRSLRLALEGAGLEVRLAASGAEARAALADEPPDCAILDLRLGDASGLEVLAQARERHPRLKAIVITAHGDVESAVQALRLGAFDFIRKPFELEEVLAAVRNALREGALERQVAYLRQSAARGGLVYQSPAMEALARTVEKVAAQPVPVVLVRGESGTGKELVARALHAASPRAEGPFVELNCSALPEQLVESELFGHERGAFSDAREQKKGLVELADGGTLFLDEIGDLPANAQAKLLKFVEGQSFRRVGGTRLLSVDCRIVAATHQDLEAGDRFRKDLYFRLAGVTLTLPPLRERGGDVLLLARHFLAASAAEYRKRLDGFTPAAEALLKGYRWPGNVRELKAAVAYAALMAEGPTVGVELLGQVERRHLQGLLSLDESLQAGRTLDQVQNAYCRAMLRLCGGNKALAAERLGISRNTLDRRLDEPGG